MLGWGDRPEQCNHQSSPRGRHGFRRHPHFPVSCGDVVRTKVGVKGDRVVKTAVVSRVRILGWHGVRGEWLYYLEGNSRRRHRWYLADDLELVTVCSGTTPAETAYEWSH